MASRRFLLLSLSGTILAMALVAGVSWKVNLYGLYGDAHGLQLSPVKNERFSKYLYGYNYIPANFDTLMVGNSVTEVLYPSELRGVKAYNLAIGASSVTEMQRLTENALDHGHFKLVILGMHPRLIRNREVGAGGLTPREWFSALGSRRIFEDDVMALWRKLRHNPPPFQTDGRVDYERHSAIKPMDADEAVKMLANRPELDMSGREIDEGALADLKVFVDAIRARGIPLAVFFPPVYPPALETFRENYARYDARVRPIFRPEEILLDFNDGTHLDVTADKTHYIDGIHLNNEWSRVASRTLDAALQRAFPSLVSPAAAAIP